jgi:hypothetical protein
MLRRLIEELSSISAALISSACAALSVPAVFAFSGGFWEAIQPGAGGACFASTS